MKQKQHKIMRSLSIQEHVLFWFLILFCFSVIQFFKDGNEQGFLLVFGQNLKRIPAMLLAAYSFNLAIPLVLRKKKYLFFLLLSIVIFYVASAFDRVVNIYFYEPLFRKEAFEQESFEEIFTNIGYLFSGYMPPLLIATSALSLNIITIEKIRYERQNLKLARDKNKAELDALKAQIHPHFLFNTLNNLYALTVQKSDNAPKMVESLSSILDYILYQCNDTFVPLSKEINLVKDYIELERLRYGEDIIIDFVIDIEMTKDQTKQIAPLLLLSIIENAFKHGVSNQVAGLEIQIHLSVVDNEILFVVKNTKNAEKLDDKMNYTNGLGITNIKQQLEQLYRDADFHHKDTGNWYHVELRINTLSVYV